MVGGRYGVWLHSWFKIPAFAGMTGGGGGNDGEGRVTGDGGEAWAPAFAGDSKGVWGIRRSAGIRRGRGGLAGRGGRGALGRAVGF